MVIMLLLLLLLLLISYPTVLLYTLYLTVCLPRTQKMTFDGVSEVMNQECIPSFYKYSNYWNRELELSLDLQITHPCTNPDKIQGSHIINSLEKKNHETPSILSWFWFEISERYLEYILLLGS